MKPGSTLHMALPDYSGDRFLHRCVVLESSEDRLTVSLAQSDLPVEAEAAVVLFYDRYNEFVQQPARVESIDTMGSVRMVDLVTTSDATSAEKRYNSRVSTVGSNARVNLGSHLECMLRDASVSGFAVISSDHYDVGQILTAELLYAGRKYTGHARVQNLRKLPDGRARYGLYCLGSRGDENDLRTGLQELTLTTKRDQRQN